jgi:hypothetical protein
MGSEFENTDVQCVIEPIALQVCKLWWQWFEQLERCCSHDLDSYISRAAISVQEIDEEVEDSDYLVSDSYNEDEECNNEGKKKMRQKKMMRKKVRTIKVFLKVNSQHGLKLA